MHWHEEIIGEEKGKYKRDVILRLFPYFLKYKKRLLFILSLLLLGTGLSLIGPLLIRHAIDVEIANKDLKGLFYLVGIYLTVQVVILIIQYLQSVWLATTGEWATADLKGDLFNHINKLPMRFFDKIPVGRLISRVESDTETVRTLFASTAVVIIRDALILIGMSVVMMSISFQLYLIILTMTPVFLLLFYHFEKSVRPVYRSVRRKVADINNFISESVRGLGIIQTFLQEEQFNARMSKLGEEKFEKEIKSLTLWYRIWFLVEFGEILGIVLVLWIGGGMAIAGKLTIGTIFLFISYISRLFMPLRGLSEQFNIIQRASASTERIFELFNTEIEESGGKMLTEFKEKIEFKDISLSYDNNEWALRNVSFNIKPGEKIALVGETGGGKTSLVSILLKFYLPNKGKILIDNEDISEIDKISLRNIFGYIPQDIILFPGSIKENLRLFDPLINDEKIFDAAGQTGLHKIIKNLPQGYETNIIEQGINLSMGERQLISLTRALIFDPKILILDEATSSVDPQTEAIVHRAMDKLLKNRTAIIIAHRLSTTRLASNVFVIHRGSLIEQGSHHQLLKKRGYYHKLYKLQYLEEKR